MYFKSTLQKKNAGGFNQMAFLNNFALNYILFFLKVSFFSHHFFRVVIFFFFDFSLIIKRSSDINLIDFSSLLLFLLYLFACTTRGLSWWIDQMAFQIASIRTIRSRIDVSWTTQQHHQQRQRWWWWWHALLTVGKWPLLSILLKIYAIN